MELNVMTKEQVSEIIIALINKHFAYKQIKLSKDSVHTAFTDANIRLTPSDMFALYYLVCNEFNCDFKLDKNSIDAFWNVDKLSDYVCEYLNSCM